MTREPERASDEMPFAQPREMRFEWARILPLSLEHIHTGTRTRAGEDGAQILPNPLEQIHPILSSPFLFIALGRSSLRRVSLSGAVRSGVARSWARFAQAWLALGRAAKRTGS